MKNLSSQLNRGTELLKQTVQRAIFSSGSPKVSLPPPPTARPTPYHSDPHAVLRSSSVDSLHLEMCHFKPIRAYTVTPIASRIVQTVRSPTARRPEEGSVVAKFPPIKVKARFKLQKGNLVSAFCTLHRTTLPAPTARRAGQASPKKARGRGAKRKRDEEQEDDDDEVEVEAVKGKVAAKKGKKSAPPVNATQAKGAKRKSLEQEKQEREDFELAKKLQREFDTHSNGDSGISVSQSSTGSRRTRNGRSLNSSVNTNYSLRTTRSLSKISSSVSPSRTEEELSPPTAKRGKRPQLGNTNGLMKSRNLKNARNVQSNETNPPRGREAELVGDQVNGRAAGRATRSKGSSRSTK